MSSTKRQSELAIKEGFGSIEELQEVLAKLSELEENLGLAKDYLAWTDKDLASKRISNNLMMAIANIKLAYAEADLAYCSCLFSK